MVAHPAFALANGAKPLPARRCENHAQVADSFGRYDHGGRRGRLQQLRQPLRQPVWQSLRKQLRTPVLQLADFVAAADELPKS
jgi:hypothetical protein